MRVTRRHLKNFILFKQGLIGPYRFAGEEGVMSYLRQAGCVQYDPIDVCGRNAELTLLSRVRGFSKGMLFSLLYEKRLLVDYWDKNMSIFPVSDWPYFSRLRQQFSTRLRSGGKVAEVAREVISLIRDRGALCAGDLPFAEKVDWGWSPTTLSRAVCETLYFDGVLVLHHKGGTKRYYDLAERLLPKELLDAPDPNRTEEEFLSWRLVRRIGGIGVLWDRPSDAFLGIDGFSSARRSAAFARLTQEGKILPLEVEGLPTLYMLSADLPLLEQAEGRDFAPRTEFLAPLDCMLWDRRLVEALFDFSYRWEIYTPVSARKYGYYVLPVLHGDCFCGRIETVAENGTLVVKNYWPEGGRPEPEGLEEALMRLAVFNGCTDVQRKK